MGDFLTYYRKVILHALKSGWSWGRNQLLNSLITAAVILVQLSLGQVVEIRSKAWELVARVLVAFVPWLIVHLLRAPWLLDREMAVEVATARKALEAEIVKNSKPELAGVAKNFSREGFGGIVGDDRSFGSARVHFWIEICNHRSVRTNIREVRINATDVDKTMTVSGITHDAPGLVLEHGISVRFRVQCDLVAQRKESMLPGAWPVQEEVDLSHLQVCVVDGLGGIHAMNVDPEAKVTF